jgi:hypothetical protein
MLPENIVTQIPLEPFVHDLCLTICLGVVTSARGQLCVIQPRQLLPKCIKEHDVPVTDNVLRQPMESEYFPEEQLC